MKNPYGQEIKSDTKGIIYYLITYDFIHLHASEFITDREVQWEILTESMESLET